MGDKTYCLWAILCFGAATSVIAQPQTSAVTIGCASTGNDRTYCPANTTDGVVLVRSTGSTACILGRNWGYDQRGIWVSEGCSGEFATKDDLLPVQPPDGSPAKDVTGFFEPYGSVRTIVSAFQDDAEIQDNATRVGIRFQTRGAIKVIAGTEWSVDLVRASTQFNPGAATSGGFVTLEQTTSPVFGARLGYVGLDAGPFGTIAFGKQNSVHYDITSYTTDRFNIFGGQASATYPAGGSDGGETGTGRADRVVRYSNKLFKIVEVGGQMQFRRAANDHTLDGWGTSAQISFFPGLKAGGSYTKTYWANDFKRTVRGLDGDAQFIAAGINGNWRILEFGFVFARQRNGDLVRLADPTGDGIIPVSFDAIGQEGFAKANLGKFAVLGGWNNYSPSGRDPAIAPDSRVRFGVFGAEWHFSPAGYVYAEMKLDSSRNSVRADDFNVYSLGFRYDFSWRVGHF